MALRCAWLLLAAASASRVQFLPPLAKLGGGAAGIPFGAKPGKAGERSGWRYTLFRQVRSGAFGRSWRAFDTEKLRQVQLAVYSEKGRGDPSKMSRDECRLLQALLASGGSFPEGKERVCKCLEAKESEVDGPYLVMEECGETLVEKLREQWREPRKDFAQDVRRWIKGGLEAVRFMSGLEEPIEHLDIRPWTLLVNGTGEAKLVDFWVARPAPAGSRQPWASDVYDLGMIYYDLLCRRRAEDEPFSALFPEEAVPWKGQGLPPGQKCADGSMGAGNRRDWAVVRAMLVPYEERPHPAELMRMLDFASRSPRCPDMFRACLVIAVASGTRIYERASDLKAEEKEADSFLPQMPIAKLGGHPPVGIPFGANPAKPGERSSWRYSLFKEVRHGPFGPTWKAFDTKRVREVDLSVYSDKGLGGELQDESREECLKLQKLIAGESKFPAGKEHICQCLESRWSEYDGAYLVMEDCGETLTEKLREQWRHPEEDFLATARGWMKQGLEAVAFLSGLEGPMGHLRLRMNNIMVNDKGDLKLVDFSWAKPSEDPHKPWAGDVYSLGAIYYELLCRSVAEDKPFAEALLRQGEEPTCRDGSLGIGTEKDWEVVKFAVADYEQRKSPQELMEMLDKAR